jgi:hypothetical protein
MFVATPVDYQQAIHSNANTMQALSSDTRDEVGWGVLSAITVQLQLQAPVSACNKRPAGPSSSEAKPWSVRRLRALAQYEHRTGKQAAILLMRVTAVAGIESDNQ